MLIPHLAVAMRDIGIISKIYRLPHFLQLDGVWWAFPIADALTILLTLALLIPQIRELKSMHLSGEKGEVTSQQNPA